MAAAPLVSFQKLLESLSYSQTKIDLRICFYETQTNSLHGSFKNQTF